MNWIMPSTAFAITKMARSSRILLTACQKSIPNFKKLWRGERVTVRPRLDASVAQLERAVPSQGKVTRSSRVGGTNLFISWPLMISVPCEVYSSRGFCNSGSVLAQCRNRGEAIHAGTSCISRTRPSFSPSAYRGYYRNKYARSRSIFA